MEGFFLEMENETLEVKELNIKDDSSVFQIWKNDVLQFNMVHNINIDGNPAWNVDQSESRNVDQDYIDEIGKQIDSIYE